MRNDLFSYEIMTEPESIDTREPVLLVGCLSKYKGRCIVFQIIIFVMTILATLRGSNVTFKSTVYTTCYFVNTPEWIDCVYKRICKSTWGSTECTLVEHEGIFPYGSAEATTDKCGINSIFNPIVGFECRPTGRFSSFGCFVPKDCGGSTYDHRNWGGDVAKVWSWILWGYWGVFAILVILFHPGGGGLSANLCCEVNLVTREGRR